MDKLQVIKTLTGLHHLLYPINRPWFVIGTTSLMLTGYPVEPNDIDILTDKQTAEAIDAILNSFKVPVELKDEGKFRSAFSRYLMSGVSVELMGNLQVATAGG
ncbi:hypothetical protein BDD43_1343 [Mucilaginibacter gracilis]|uniref:Nucleotidyltransferase AbiEii toxin of type IV toxin-antitoxin system n=1 Tax=Mucilaginibacter gracilis TaxID=423350 RepID=A0A495IYQ1_9SPHI|nr:hypothetical protein [Mucilaginibacter gracilis]RKR81198.1 hypothetical protein BDD43_1343 [Mucilaginibacter gracilis]